MQQFQGFPALQWLVPIHRQTAITEFHLNVKLLILKPRGEISNYVLMRTWKDMVQML